MAEDKDTQQTITVSAEFITTIKDALLTVINLLETYTTKTTRSEANANYNVYAEAKYPVFGAEPNHFNSLLHKEKTEAGQLFAYGLERKQKNDLLWDLAILQNLTHGDNLDTATLEKFKDVQQAANRGDDNTLTTDKFSDERYGKNETNVDDLKQALLAISNLASKLDNIDVVVEPED